MTYRSEIKIVNKTKDICTNSRLWQCFVRLSFSKVRDFFFIRIYIYQTLTLAVLYFIYHILKCYSNVSLLYICVRQRFVNSINKKRRLLNCGTKLFKSIYTIYKQHLKLIVKQVFKDVIMNVVDKWCVSYCQYSVCDTQKLLLCIQNEMKIEARGWQNNLL